MDLILIVGQEGVGKSTIIRELVWKIPDCGAIDGEDLAMINPWDWDDKFKRLLATNVFTVVNNFFNVGCSTVFAGSFFDSYEDLYQIRDLIPPQANLTILHLCAPKEIRDDRRQNRAKCYNQEESDWVDENFPEATDFENNADQLRYIRIENSGDSIQDTVSKIVTVISRKE